MEGPRERGPLARALETFANAVIERTLPRIRSWLVTRLGPRAELSALELDGARVHLVGVRLPLGPRAVLHASRATFVTHAEDLVAGLPPLHLERMDGTVELGLGGPPMRVTLEGSASPVGDAWVEGTLLVRELALGGALFDGRSDVRVTSERFSFEDTRLVDAARSSSLDLAVRGSFVAGTITIDEVQTSLESVAVLAFVELLAALRGASIEAPLPLDETTPLSGRATLDREGAISLELRAGGRAHLTLEGRASPDGPLDAEGRGEIDPALLRLPHASFSGTPATVALTLTGTRPRASIELLVLADRVELRSDRATGAALVLTRARARWVADERGLTLDASARADRGSIRWTREPGSPARVKLDRVELGPILAALDGSHDPTVRAWIDALALDRAQIWAKLVVGELVTGAAQIESPNVQLGLDPLRLAGTSLDGSRIRASLRACALAPLSPALRGANGSVEVGLELERASLERRESVLAARGTIRADRIELAPRDGVDLVLTDVRAELSIDDRRLRVTSAEACLFGGWIRSAFSIRSGTIEIESLGLDALSGRVAHVLLALLGIDRHASMIAPDAIFPGLVLDAELAREDGALRGTVSARSDRSSLSLRAIVDEGGRIGGTTLEGSIFVGDVAPLVLSWTIRPDDEARWTLAGSLEGTVREPVLTLEARCDQQPVRIVARRTQVVLDAREVSAWVRVTRERFSWSELTARGYGGLLRSRGAWIGSRVLSARVEAEGVDLALIPLPRGALLGAHVGGTMCGTLDILRPAVGKTVARGRVRVESPRYGLLARAARTASRLELPLPELAGLAPLEAELRLHAGGWSASELSARLRELSVRGFIDVSADGGLAGLLSLRPEPAWLRQSRFLAPVAELLSDVPLHLSGTLGAPRAGADAISAADGLLARTSLGRRVRALLERLAPEAFARPSRAGDGRRSRGTVSLLSTEALFERLAQETEDACELFEALLERGLSAEEIASRTARQRR